jgi:hypothetical protein
MTVTPVDAHQKGRRKGEQTGQLWANAHYLLWAEKLTLLKGLGQAGRRNCRRNTRGPDGWDGKQLQHACMFLTKLFAPHVPSLFSLQKIILGGISLIQKEN